MSTEICNLCEHIASNQDGSAAGTYTVKWICTVMHPSLHYLSPKEDRGHIYILTPPDCPLKKSKSPNYYGTFLEEEA